MARENVTRTDIIKTLRKEKGSGNISSIVSLVDSVLMQIDVAKQSRIAKGKELLEKNPNFKAGGLMSRR